jgi:hypothetical protein
VALAVVAVGLPVLGGSSAQAAVCDPPVTNKVACENTHPGTPESQWRVTPDDDIAGFTTDISVNAGGQVSFKVLSKVSQTYDIRIYRLGWYGGNGARLIGAVSNVQKQNQPFCATDATGLYDCANWAVSATWTVPSTAVSGLYYAVLHRNDTGGENEVFFVVRDDASQSAMLFQTSDITWQAYNRYEVDQSHPGSSLYSGVGPGPAGSAWMVSYNRPLQGPGDENLPFNAEYPMIRFLEQNGYDLSYQAGVDTDRLGAAVLAQHDVFLSVGHDEYWSAGQRANVESARAAGVDLAFFSANEVFWKVRYQADSAGAAYRTIVCYKETKANAKIDPSPAWTGTWRDPRFSPPSDGGRPENALIGQQFIMNGRRDDSLQVPSAYGKMRLWRNTPLASLPSGQTYSFAPGTLGYEWDTYADNGSQPPGVAQLSRTTVTVPPGLEPSDKFLLLNYGDEYGPGTATHSLTLYKDQSSGALVFGAGTVQWSWGLDDYHEFQTGSPTSDVRIRQATVNLFADMGVQPATLASGLVAASASTDTAAPTVTVGTPSPDPPVVGTATTFTGTVSDAAGKVAGVEVSVDGGTSWHPAAWQAGAANWSYVYTPNHSGPLTVKVRAADDSANLSAPVSQGFTVAMRDCPCSIWNDSVVPANPATSDPSAVELGVKFRSDVAGYVRGVRFYKGAGNTGTHTGSLWTTAGALLKTGTFANETASGWQTLTFPHAVAIAANTTYIVSYHTNTGHYAAESGAFANQSVYNEPLTATQNAAADPNGVYRLGASGFPDSTYGATNYWVDVVFALDPGPDTQPPNVLGRSPAPGTPNATLAGPVTATFDEPVNPASLVFTVKQGGTTVPGSVSVSGDGTTATFTPSPALAGGTAYDVSVRAADPTGNLMPAADTWSFTTGQPRPPTCPCTVWDDFTSPAVANTQDPGPMELGTKVRFDINGYVTGIRFFKGSQNTGTHTGTLWSASGTALRTGTFSGETASGWQALTFATPVQVTANTTYVVSYHTNTGYYSSSAGYFGSQGSDYQALHALRSGVDGDNGVYRYGASGFPTSSYGATNYWVDVLFTNSLTGDTTPPSVTGTTPVAGATSVPLAGSLTATFDEDLDPGSITFTLKDGGGAAITGTVGYDAANRRATFAAAAPLAAGETYTASVRAADTSSNLMAAPVSWSFTTTTTQTCPCSLYSAATVPTVAAVADTGAYEFGTRFTSSVDATVTGVKFYKGPGNGGTHTGSLWSAAGALLATGTFTGETATGWQTLTFASPVPITAGQVYVASYTVSAGRYSADTTYFEQGPATSNPLVAPATAAGSGNGLYKAGSGFPDNTYRGTNYWVDVVVTTGG